MITHHRLQKSRSMLKYEQEVNEVSKLTKMQIQSHYDQLVLGITIMEPDGDVIGLLHIAHGMCEYKERYDAFLEYMSSHGFICVIHDHRGHGESIKQKDDLGYFYDDTGEFIVEDLHQIIVEMKQKYPNLPCFLLGHSMGSLVVRTYTKKYDYEIDGLIVCGSPSKNKLAGVGKLLTKLMIKCKGGRYRSKFIHRLAFSAYGKKFNESSEHAWICTQKHVVEAYDADEYCNFIFTLNGFLNLFTLMIRTYDDENWLVRHPSLPIFFVAGSEDPCIGNEDKFRNAAYFMKKVGYSYITSKLYPGKRHEILNEDIKEDVSQDIYHWLLEAMKTRQEK